MDPVTFLLLLAAVGFTTYKVASMPDGDATAAGASHPTFDGSAGLHDFGTDDESTYRFDDSISSILEPAFNIDGTPMYGSIDINGNFYGMTGSPFDSWCGDSWRLFDD